MSDVRHSSFGLPHPEAADLPSPPDDRAAYPTPAMIIGQIARVVAVCLVLGLLARVLVSFTGIQ